MGNFDTIHDKTKLLNCLNEFNDEEKMIDLSETPSKIKTIKQLKDEDTADCGEYWIRENKYHYGKVILKSICCIYGTLYRQVRNINKEK
jgi:hypothetical protein